MTYLTTLEFPNSDSWILTDDFTSSRCQGLTTSWGPSGECEWSIWLMEANTRAITGLPMPRAGFTLLALLLEYPFPVSKNTKRVPNESKLFVTFSFLFHAFRDLIIYKSSADPRITCRKDYPLLISRPQGVYLQTPAKHSEGFQPNFQLYKNGIQYGEAGRTRRQCFS